ncbi:MAG TPA: hypothetical protein VGX78_15800 [Pirellulales bacterium]|nr:hypothetical protein [Pirellulales bacterium]
MFALCFLAASLHAPGCARWQTPPPPVANPVFVPLANYDYVWDRVVDVVDNYFKVKREDRVRLLSDGTLTPGRLDTVPDTSSTLLEPWRMDTVTFYDKLESTFQSMRKYTIVQVIPAEAGGFLVEMVVFKELEDVPRPLYSSAGEGTFRYDTSQAHTKAPVNQQTPTRGWIPKGRDTALEQRMLRQLLAKLGVGPPFWQTQPPFCYLPEFQGGSRLAARP